MITDNNNNNNNISEDEEDLAEEDLVIWAAATSAIAAALAVLDYTQWYYNKRPFHDSAISDIAWACELLSGHPEPICRKFGVHKHVFWALITALKDAVHRRSKSITLKEQLSIFLYICVTGLSLVHICEYFQWAPDTTSKYINSSFLFIIADQAIELQIFSHLCNRSLSRSHMWMLSMGTWYYL